MVPEQQSRQTPGSVSILEGAFSAEIELFGLSRRRISANQGLNPRFDLGNSLIR